MDTASKEAKEENSLNAPITFSQFVKNPITGMLFLCILAIGYLMYDTKQVTKRQEERIEQLEQEVRKTNADIRELQAENSALKVELNLRKELKNFH
jgi:Tfp pilus assembly protein PilN